MFSLILYTELWLWISLTSKIIHFGVNACDNIETNKHLPNIMCLSGLGAYLNEQGTFNVQLVTNSLFLTLELNQKLKCDPKFKFSVFLLLISF